MISHKFVDPKLMLFLTILVLFFSCKKRDKIPILNKDTTIVVDSFLEEEIGRNYINDEAPITDFSDQNKSEKKVGEYNKYCNQRFSFCAKYPTDFQVAKMQSDNNDGVILIAADSSSIIILSASYNILCDSIESLIELRKKIIQFENPKLISITQQPNSFTIKGKTKLGFYYTEKVLLSEDRIGSYVIKYNLANVKNPILFIDTVLNSLHFYEVEERLERVVQ